MASLNTQALDGGQGTTGETITTNTPDPFRDFFLNLLKTQSSTSSQVPGFTKAALEEFTRNPAGAGAEFFPQLADPLLSALRPSEGREIQQLNDQFRKAGGTGGGALQSGAFAQANRQLINDQANRRQETLARNFVPLTSQISENQTNAIRAGLALPEAESGFVRNLVPLGTSLPPSSTRTQSTGVTQNLTIPGGQPDFTQQDQLARLAASFSNLKQPGRFF